MCETGVPTWVLEVLGCYDGPDLTITRERRDPVSARLVEVVSELGEPSVRDVTEHVDLKGAAVRRRLRRLAEEGELVRIQGSCGPGAGDRFAVPH